MKDDQPLKPHDFPDTLVRESMGPERYAEQLEKLIQDLQTRFTDLESQNNELLGILDRSKENYDQLYNFAPVGYISLDVNGIVLKANITATRILNVSIIDLINKPFSGFFENQELPAYSEFLEDLRKTNDPINLQTRLRINEVDSVLVQISGCRVDEVENLAFQFRLTITEITDLKQSIPVLEKGDENFRAIVESAPEAIFVQIGGRFAYLNSPALILFGLKSQSEMIGQRVLDRIRPDFHEVVSESIRLVGIEKKQVRNLEQVYRKMDGSEIEVEVSAVPLRFHGEDGALVFARDITERDKMNKALRDSEKLLKRSQAMSHVGSWELDLETDVLKWSEEVYRICGVPPSSFKANYGAFLDLIHPDDRERVDEVYRRSIRAGENVYEIEHRIIRKNSGEIRTVHEKCEHVRDLSGKIIRSIGMIQDITEGKKAEKDLRKIKEELESTVNKRTSELRKVNERLSLELTERTKAQEALRESEERFRQVAKIAGEWIWEIDLNGCYSYCSSAVKQILGYTPEELIGKKRFHDLLYPFSDKFVEETLPFTFSTKKTFKQFENIKMHKTGTVVFLETTCSPFYNSSGELMGYRGVDIDITNRKKIENDLKASESRYHSIFDGSAEGILVVDPETMRFKYANQAICRMLGYSSDELIDLCVYDIHPKSLMYEVITEFRELVSGKKEKAEAIPCLKKNGNTFLSDISTTLIEIDGHPCHVGFFRDVTDRKKAEDALRESEERFRSVFESATECIYILDKDLRVTHVNPAVTNLFGIPSSQLIGKGALDLYGRELGKQIVKINSRVLKGERIEHEQVRIIGGIPANFHDIRVPLRDAQNKITGICCLSRQMVKTLTVDRLDSVVEEFSSPAMLKTLKLAKAAARSKGIVLLLGESGSGKDYLARWIHDHSRYTSGPFISVNCAALPPGLVESELFGHERGAFTGAMLQKKGQFELAEGGTILLNEIGELDLAVQAKLLTFLDTNSFLRVGGQKSVRVNARILAATHRDLRSEISHDRFLEPLFYRLSVLTIEVPPLRHRIEDIPNLVNSIIKKVGLETQLSELPALDQQHFRTLSQYSWPGNVRELRNVIERSLILWDGGRLNLAIEKTFDIAEPEGIRVTYLPGKSLRDAHQQVTAYFIEESLERCGGDKTRAASLLGISRDAFYRYIKKVNTSS